MYTQELGKLDSTPHESGSWTIWATNWRREGGHVYGMKMGRDLRGGGGNGRGKLIRSCCGPLSLSLGGRLGCDRELTGENIDHVGHHASRVMLAVWVFVCEAF